MPTHDANLNHAVNTIAEVSELRAVNAELLAALKMVCDASADASQSKFAAAVIKARAAISRATGGGK